jgi:hypothetical protein
VFAETEEQLIWSQYDNEPVKLGEELLKLDPKLLTESAKYFISSNSLERK